MRIQQEDLFYYPLRIQAFYVKSKEQEFLVILAVHCIMSNYGHIW